MLEHFRTADAELFRELGEICAHLTRSAELLERLLAGEADAERPLAAEIRRSDDQAHALAAHVDTRTFKAFVMRVDRMEMHELALVLDAAIEAMDDVAGKAPALHVSHAPAQLQHLAGGVTRVTRELERAVQHVGSDREAVAAAAAEIREAKEDGDVAYYAGVKELFAHAGEAIEVVRWKDAYDDVSRLLASCVAVGRLVQEIAERYA
ncbi:MAG TPA: DUF47 family protein [Gemmatimonadaceae bacterium]